MDLDTDTPRTGYAPDFAALAAQAMADATILGLIVVDRDLRPFWTNATAENLLAGKCGISLKDGTLVASRPSEQKQLLALIAAMASAHEDKPAKPSCMLLTPALGRASIYLQVLPVNQHGEPAARSAPVALLALKDISNCTNLYVDLAATVYGLSEAEKRVLVGLLNGMSVSQISQHLKRAVPTVRSELVSLFGKTGVNRQSHLIAAVLSFPDCIAKANAARQ